MVKMSYLKLKGNVNILVGGIMSLNQSSLHRWMEFTMPRNQKILLFFGHMLEGIGSHGTLDDLVIDEDPAHALGKGHHPAESILQG